MTFKQQHPEIQQLVRELQLLRTNNLKFKEGDSQDGLLLFAEASLVLLVLERFIRAILSDATDRETLRPLLRRAIERKLILLPWDDQEDGIGRLVDVRNTILHGNYEQAAKQAGCSSVAEYFKTVFASEVEKVYQVVDHLFNQIDANTGQPIKAN